LWSKMKKTDETRQKLISELAKLRQQIIKLEKSETENKRAAQALRESEEKFRSIAESSPNMIFINSKGRVVYANKKCEETVGYKRKEFYSPDFDFFTLIASESMNLIKESYGKHQKGEEILPYEYTLITKKGKRLEAIITTKLIDYGRERAILGIVTDITERKRMEKKLEESEENYRQLAGSILDVFFEMDKNLRYTYWNKASEKLTGIPAKDAIGKSLYEIFPDVKGTKAEKKYKEVLKTQKPTTFINRFRLGDDIYFFEISAYPSQRGLSVFVKDITERKKAEEELRESREEYISVTNLTGDIIVKLDKEGKWTFLNDGACKFWGEPREKLLGVNFADYLHSEDNKKTNSAVQKMIRTKQIVGRLINRQKTPKGWRTVEWNATPIFDKKGKYAGMQATGRDITEQKKAEQTLKESEERYRDLVEKADMAIVIEDKKGNFKYFNKKFAELFGYSEAEMKKKSIRTLVYPEDARWVIEFHEARLRGGNIPSRYELRGVRKDGSTIHLEVDVGELKEGKSIIGTRSYIWDITERKMAEKELRQSEEKFRSVVVNSSDAIISADAQGKIIFWNPAAKNMFGYSSEEAIGKPYEIILPERFHPIFKKSLKQIVLWKRLGIIENRTEMIGLRKDGREFPMEVSLSSWLTKEGIFFSSSIRDITEDKKAKEKLKREYAELKNSVKVKAKGN
jgi:PAS domain S-box-containing protein